MPLLNERITSFETPITRAAFQLKQVCKQLELRPITLWDSEYGNARFLNLTADINADLLIRIRPNRCVWGKPKSDENNKMGRPKIHGHKMKLSDPTTWKVPVESIEIDELTWGTVEIQRWSQFHFSGSADRPMEIILIQRKGKGLSKKAAKPMWLAWIGKEKLSLEELWKYYLRRFAIEHWNRFVKQRLHWTLPKLGTTEKGQRWSDIICILTWQLWLAREIIEDNPLPWQKSQPLEKLTPGRVAQSFSGLLGVIGTPAKPPKPRGKSIGWEKGKKRKKKPHYPVVKKTVTRQKKDKKEAS